MKKTRSMLALLACLALLVSLCAVPASAAEVVTNTADFTKLEVNTDTAGIAAATGVVFPEITRDDGTTNTWYISELGSITLEDGTMVPNPPALTPTGGCADYYYIQTLNAGEGKIFASDATLDIAYMLATGLGWVVAEVSTDGENWVEAAADDVGTGNDWDVTFSNYREFKGIPLPGTAGASTVYVRITVQRMSGQYSANVHYTSISGATKDAPRPLQPGEVSNTADFTQLPINTDTAGIAAATGVVFPEITRDDGTTNTWYISELGSITLEDGTMVPNPPALTPTGGCADYYYIQTLSAGEGKVFASDATLDIGYMLATGLGWVVAEVSTDGENWVEAAADDVGTGNDWDVTFSNYREFKGIPLPGTAGASTVYVRITVQRMSGQYSGNVHYTTISGMTEDAEGGSDPVTPPPTTGDMFAAIAALAMVCAAGAVITTKKIKEN